MPIVQITFPRFLQLEHDITIFLNLSNTLVTLLISLCCIIFTRS